ncbi:glycoside hydrolase family 65 [Treponema sp. J25]|uniref:glycoside hydrolase family 65 n=1 Tax=Treponema sp. J25 TaxID=2094121 RepID=UPI001052719D|nr:glycoside hydrolase family 65 [Treponema sp. J25]TCW61089.1 glycoside hydrolase family 65 [Treponema sp. J25]
MGSAIDRKALVRRHCPSLHRYDPWAPLSIGNGEFAFTADVTGLQNFLPPPGAGIPLCTMAQWGWHSYPESEGLQEYQLRKQYFEIPCQPAAGQKRDRRSVGYMTDPTGQDPLFTSLRINPHRFNLARFSFVVRDTEGSPWRSLLMDDVGEPRQYGDLWEGIVYSSFTLKGNPVGIEGTVAPDADILAFRLCSPLLEKGLLGIQISFPYASHEESASDWKSPEKHETRLVQKSTPFGAYWSFVRILDATVYFVQVQASPGVSLTPRGASEPHAFWITADRPELEVAFWFLPHLVDDQKFWAAKLFTGEFRVLWHEISSRSQRYWESFWGQGGIVDFSDSTDPRAAELERRVVLSQYLTAIQCAGSLPPQETGLTCNSWYGKFHLEMHYWHAAHFIQWGRPELFERSFLWYKRILPRAKERAASQGYRGARWPKMTEPAGSDAPSPIGPLLCWQEPHPIMYGELLSRRQGLPAVLATYGELFWETAEFMADFLQWDEKLQRFCLGPPLIPVQECHDPRRVLNPTFEIEYWYWALQKAIEWYEGASSALSAPSPEYSLEKWKDVVKALAKPPSGIAQTSGLVVYFAHENCPETFPMVTKDHPSMLLALGMLPGRRIEAHIMVNTLEEVLKSWDFSSCWGWDFPALAMTAARLERRDDAVNILLMESPKNTYLPNGHNVQWKNEGAPGGMTRSSSSRRIATPGLTTSRKAGEKTETPSVWSGGLPVYLPGNGALLLAVGMMAAGWDGAPSHSAPGFPNDGRWHLRWEGLIPLPE